MKDQPEITPATFADYPTIQNMARFYVYDLSRECGFISSDWAIPADGLYESTDFEVYFKDPTRKAYLVKVADELAGFVLLNQVGIEAKTNWNMGEFFILAKFQGHGIGSQVAKAIWDMHPGLWEVSVIPENKSAFNFWRKTIGTYTDQNYAFETKLVTYDEYQPQRIIFSFTIGLESSKKNQEDIIIRPAEVSDLPSYVNLSSLKRRSYEKAQPQFWRYRGTEAEKSQLKWFEEIITQEDYIPLTAERNGKVLGFIIGRLISAPEVYDLGGLTLMIDDFCVEAEANWSAVGGALLKEIKKMAKARGARQILVVCGAHDEPKRTFLKSIGLSVASEWYVGAIV